MELLYTAAAAAGSQYHNPKLGVEQLQKCSRSKSKGFRQNAHFKVLLCEKFKSWYINCLANQAIKNVKNIIISCGMCEYYSGK